MEQFDVTEILLHLSIHFIKTIHVASRFFILPLLNSWCILVHCHTSGDNDMGNVIQDWKKQQCKANCRGRRYQSLPILRLITLREFLKAICRNFTFWIASINPLIMLHLPIPHALFCNQNFKREKENNNNQKCYLVQKEQSKQMKE